jgi:hypothetical protein
MVQPPRRSPTISVIGEETVLTGPLVGGAGGKVTPVTPLIREREKVASLFGWLAVNPIFTVSVVVA